MRNFTIMSRRGFLGAGSAFGGGLLVATSFAGASLADTIVRGTVKGAEPGFKPSAYIEIGLNGDVILTIGKSEMGQGTLTGIAQLIADELECDWDKITIVQANTDPAFGLPFNGLMITGGSSGLRTEWMRMRSMGAAARMMLQQAAADRWGVDVASLAVKNSIVSGHGDLRATFADLATDASKLTVPENPPLKPAGKRTLIGKPIKRLDTLQKINGQAEFGIDVQVPDMLTAVVITGPQFMAPVKSYNADKALARPGVVTAVQISTGVAIVADHYWAAHSARDDVDVQWGTSPFSGLGMADIQGGYRKALSGSGLVAESKGDISSLPATRTVEREFEQPFLAHACMEPMNFTVSIGENSAEVWGPTQAQSFVQATVGRIAGIEPENVVVHTTFLGGGFGRRSAQDFVQAATEIAMAVGRPVKLVYSREDDMRAGRYRPFSITRAAGTLDAAGNLSALEVRIAKPSVSKWSGLLFLIRKDGVDLQAVEGLINLPYDIPNTRVEWVDHDSKIPVHFWRAVGSSHNPFVVESLMDDLAKHAGRDPLEFRRQLLKGRPRHLAVLDRLAREADWATPAPAGVGRGLALVESFESIVAQAVELRIVDGDLKIDRVTCVIDCGVAVNPGQIEAQMHSSIIFGLSAFLRGEITLAAGQIEQSNFHDYEPLRMNEIPRIDVSIIEGSDKPGGVGEPGLPPVLPATANALFALTGERLTRLPHAS